MVLNLEQNGRDCAAWGIGVVCVLWKDGCTFRRHGKGELASPDSAVGCMHNVRTRVLKMLAVELHESYHWFLRIPEVDDGSVTDEVMSIMVAGVSNFHNVARMEATLAEEASECQVCQTKRAVGLEAADQGGEDDDEWVASDEDVFAEDDDGEHQDVHGDDGDGAKLADIKRRFPDLKKAGVKLRGMEGREINPLKVVKKVKMIELEPRRFEMLPRNKCVDFDEYFNGPSLEDQRIFKSDCEGWQPTRIYGSHKPAFRSTGETFRDCGFRILPEFCQMFADSKPQKVKEHCFPPVDPDLLDTSERSCQDRNTMVLGMEQMNQLVKDHPEWLVDVFVKGMIGRKFIKLDAGRDDCMKSKYENVSFRASMDIDSIIIVMHKLVLSADVEVAVLPTGSKRPPFTKSTHTWVRLLQPQSEMDKEKGGREEWFETLHSPSQLPHMHFGKVDGSFSMAIVFPRMKHRNPVNGRSATLIPWEIQNQFLVEVLHPAMAFASDEARNPYIDYDIETWRWKSTTMYGFKKTVLLQHDQLPRLQEAMDNLIQSDEELAHFGSFFFVMEAKGIKLRTMTMDSAVDVLGVLQEKFPCVDFEMLSKRENGQVLMDLGMGYHAVGMDGSKDLKFVCLWDLERLHQSYGQAGFNKGTVHHANTMAWFGGRQSPLRKDRLALVQVCFRSSYGLYYEPFRKVKGGEISFCDDWDAYQTNKNFLDSVDHYIRIMEEAKAKSLGVRDEVRASLMALRELLVDLPNLASFALMF